MSDICKTRTIRCLPLRNLAFGEFSEEIPPLQHRPDRVAGSGKMIHRGAREFIVDLCNCSVMDSTFMGTLAGISLWLGELGEGCLSVVNLNERNAESLWSLGLDQLFNVRVSAIKKDGQALPIPLEEDRTARAQTMLEAHEALIKTAPENLPKFKDVIQYLEEELHLSK